MSDKEIGFFKIDERIARNDLAKGTDDLNAIARLLNTNAVKENIKPETLTKISEKVKNLAVVLSNDVNTKINGDGKKNKGRFGLGNLELSNDAYVLTYTKEATKKINTAVDTFAKTENANIDDLLKDVESQMKGMNEFDIQLAKIKKSDSTPQDT